MDSARAHAEYGHHTPEVEPCFEKRRDDGPGPFSSKLIVDEAATLMDYESEATFLEDLVRRARKYYVGVTLITQQPLIFKESSIPANCATHVLMRQDATSLDLIEQMFHLSSFRMSADDANKLSCELDVDPEDIVHLDPLTCYLKVVSRRQQQLTFSCRLSFPPAPSDEEKEQAEQIRRRCQQRYMRPVSDIEVELFERLARERGSIHRKPLTVKFEAYAQYVRSLQYRQEHRTLPQLLVVTPHYGREQMVRSVAISVFGTLPFVV